jgi:MFS family permease
VLSIVSSAALTGTKSDWKTSSSNSPGNLRAYFVAFLCGDVAIQIQSVAIAWHVFTLHHRTFDLGLVGLTLFIPSVVLVFVTGIFADRHSRKSILVVTTIAEIAATGAFIGLVFARAGDLWPYLAIVLTIGVSRAFSAPAERALLLNLVPHDRFMSVSSAYSSIRQLLVVGGPAAGGALLAIGTPFALFVVAVILAASLAGLIALRIPKRAAVARETPVTMHDALGGLHFVRSRPIVLGAISLDLFAVLFGGATALLPAYADTIFHVGPVGLGLLRSAPAVGGFAMAAYLARRPPAIRVGRTLLIAVAVFGTATIVFGASHSLVLALVALVVVGASDMVSVVIRRGLVQLNTPDHMRGRVNALENVFIGASNELGEFESGTLAAFIGTAPAVIAGGLGTLAVVALSAVCFPQLRRADRFAPQEP